MKFNDNYREVKAIAQARANATGFDYAIERGLTEFLFFRLPAREARTLRESKCEVVSCDQVEATQPGHGPAPRRGQ